MQIASILRKYLLSSYITKLLIGPIMTTNLFWQQRWQDNNIGFHQADVNPLLLQFMPTLNLKPGAKIFVPFCGATVDMAYLVQQGYQIIGSEISELACEQFFAEQNREYQLIEQDGFKIYQSENIQLYCGDHYQLQPEWFGDVCAVYDRAALIAVEPTLRKKYVEKLQQLIPGYVGLLVTVNYADNGKSGPPFSISAQQAKRLFAPMYPKKIAELDDSAACRSLESRGYKSVVEDCYLLG